MAKQVSWVPPRGAATGARSSKQLHMVLCRGSSYTEHKTMRNMEVETDEEERSNTQDFVSVSSEGLGKRVAELVSGTRARAGVGTNE